MIRLGSEGGNDIFDTEAVNEVGEASGGARGLVANGLVALR